MGWTFGGIAVKNNHSGSFQSLLGALNLRRTDTGNRFNFSSALSQKNTGTAIGIINDCTVLLDPLLPYDCSYTEDEESRFDKTLTLFSKEAETLVFMLDSISGTYAFSFLGEGECKRKWAAEPGNILCNEGDYLEAEVPFITGNASALRRYSSEGEARVFAVIESFLGVGFDGLTKDNQNLFHLFI